MPQKIYFRSSNIEPYPLELVGESNYQANILSVIPPQDGTGVEIMDAFCELILENDNRFDNQAVKVEIDRLRVGYLSKDDARQYRSLLSKLSKSPVIGICYASITGGYGKETKRRYGVRLDLDLTRPLEIIPSQPISQNGITPKPFTQKVIKILRWAFAPKRWWKTLLVLFVILSVIKAILN